MVEYQYIEQHENILVVEWSVRIIDDVRWWSVVRNIWISENDEKDKHEHCKQN